MIGDLHAHYAMHLAPELPGTLDSAAKARGRHRLRDRLRALAVGILSRFANYRSFDSGPRVTLTSLREGGVGVVLSVLYSPFDEMDLSKPYGAPPEPEYLYSLLDQMYMVEYNLEHKHGSTAAIAKHPGQIDAAIADGKVAFVHCVEGGFHLGRTPGSIEDAVAQLAQRGVAYITLAHLFWRTIATNAPAIPFIPDDLYREIFPQPEQGLSQLGAAAVMSMVRHRVLVDIAHMSTRARTETLDLLDELDPENQVPVLATHAGYRFGRQEYMLDAGEIARIAARRGVIGLIFAEHQILDGLLRKRTRSFDDSFGILCEHIDRIGQIAGSHRHVAIGSDLDGFIKPTLAGLQSMADMATLEQALTVRYGDDAELITSGNAIRVLRSFWGQR